jgi:hypothetical protein
MADIILAEIGGNAWLVCGEQYIDDLLGNTLEPHVTIEVATCESKSEVDAMWRRNGGGTDESDMMWMIHPAILRRARGQSGPLAIQFAAWSAMMDEAAQSTLQLAAEMIAARPGAALVLVRHLVEGSPAMAGELGNLRAGLIEGRLAELGVDPSRISRETAAAGAESAERIDLVIRPI